MKNPAPALGVALLLAAAATAQAQNPAAVSPAPAAPAPAGSTLQTPKDKLSYAIGMDIAQTLKRQGIDVDPAVVSTAVREGFGPGPMQMTEAQSKEVLEAFRNEFVAKRQAAAKVDAEKGKAEGEAFLVANKTKEGVKTTASGLQYKVLTEGTGPTPTAGDTVSTNYRGTLVNGTEFDSSFKRNQPASFPVTGVIKGWTEALQMMKVGSKWQLFVPANLAYGESGTPGGPIGPNSTLIFDIELLGIQGK